ncbi:MAG: gfo/Idh/MocA family oxidoreductase, partial [Bacteroidetes bacterium]
EEALEIARSKDLCLVEAMWTWFLPAVLKAKQWIVEGRIGEVRFLRADCGFKPEFNAESRVYNPNLAAGALLDIGIYPLAIAEFLIDSDIKNMRSVGYLGSTGIDEYNAMSVEYQNGIFAQLSSGVVSDLHNDAYIIGTKGIIRLENFWMSKKAILETPAGKEIFEDELPCHGYNYETDHVNELLLQGKKESPVVSFEKSRRSMQRMDAIRKEMGLKYPFE